MVIATIIKVNKRTTTIATLTYDEFSLDNLSDNLTLKDLLDDLDLSFFVHNRENETY